MCCCAGVDVVQWGWWWSLSRKQCVLLCRRWRRSARRCSQGSWGRWWTSLGWGRTSPTLLPREVRPFLFLLLFLLFVVERWSNPAGELRVPPYLGTATAAAVMTEVLNLLDDAMRIDENVLTQSGAGTTVKWERINNLVRWEKFSGCKFNMLQETLNSVFMANMLWKIANGVYKFIRVHGVHKFIRVQFPVKSDLQGFLLIF